MSSSSTLPRPTAPLGRGALASPGGPRSAPSSPPAPVSASASVVVSHRDISQAFGMRKLANLEPPTHQLIAQRYGSTSRMNMSHEQISSLFGAAKTKPVLSHAQIQQQYGTRPLRRAPAESHLNSAPSTSNSQQQQQTSRHQQQHQRHQHLQRHPLSSTRSDPGDRKVFHSYSLDSLDEPTATTTGDRDRGGDELSVSSESALTSATPSAFSLPSPTIGGNDHRFSFSVDRSHGGGGFDEKSDRGGGGHRRLSSLEIFMGSIDDGQRRTSTRDHHSSSVRPLKSTREHTGGGGRAGARPASSTVAANSPEFDDNSDFFGSRRRHVYGSALRTNSKSEVPSAFAQSKFTSKTGAMHGHGLGKFDTARRSLNFMSVANTEQTGPMANSSRRPKSLQRSHLYSTSSRRRGGREVRTSSGTSRSRMSLSACGEDSMRTILEFCEMCEWFALARTSIQFARVCGMVAETVKEFVLNPEILFDQEVVPEILRSIGATCTNLQTFRCNAPVAPAEEVEALSKEVEKYRRSHQRVREKRAKLKRARARALKAHEKYLAVAAENPVSAKALKASIKLSARLDEALHAKRKAKKAERRLEIENPALSDGSLGNLFLGTTPLSLNLNIDHVAEFVASLTPTLKSVRLRNLTVEFKTREWLVVDVDNDGGSADALKSLLAIEPKSPTDCWSSKSKIRILEFFDIVKPEVIDGLLTGANTLANLDTCIYCSNWYDVDTRSPRNVAILTPVLPRMRFGWFAGVVTPVSIEPADQVCRFEVLGLPLAVLGYKSAFFPRLSKRAPLVKMLVLAVGGGDNDAELARLFLRMIAENAEVFPALETVAFAHERVPARDDSDDADAAAPKMSNADFRTLRQSEAVASGVDGARRSRPALQLRWLEDPHGREQRHSISLVLEYRRQVLSKRP